MTILEEAFEINDETIKTRRDFHRHPELGLEEFRTAAIVAEKLEALGLEVSTGIGKTGVVGLLKGKSESPVLLLRFDMDALPIQEDTGAAYASENPGKMHACGHDCHTAVGLSVAKLLTSRRDELAGTIKFVFQPGEEGAGGAELMVADGVLDDPKPNYSMAMHVWNDKPVGWYGLTPGPIMAGAHIFTVKIKGKGGHGASPHQTVDPVVAAAQIITALQTITSRNVNPLDSAVVSVCTVASGTAFNIIPQEATIEGTIRTFKMEVCDKVFHRFDVIVNHIAEAMGCTAEIDSEQITFPVSNDPKLVQLMNSVIKDVDPDAQIDPSHQTMGSEDFSFMMQDIPGCFIMVGSANHEKGLDYSHHHPKFNIDETCLPFSVALIAQGAVEILRMQPEAGV
ncbi:MAG: M20 family metallopeptidase [Chloroflexota bacterium]|nr:M20 family metallopeptidase [Chloroflexota bacterium]